MVFSAVMGSAPEPGNEIYLYGSQGTLHLDLDAGHLEMALKAGACVRVSGTPAPWPARCAASHTPRLCPAQLSHPPPPPPACAEGGHMQPVDVPHEARGFWRVEQEFVGAIRGTEKVKLTDFSTGVRYMEFTEAVARSAQSGVAVPLPLP